MSQVSDFALGSMRLASILSRLGRFRRIGGYLKRFMKVLVYILINTIVINLYQLDIII